MKRVREVIGIIGDYDHTLAHGLLGMPCTNLLVDRPCISVNIAKLARVDIESKDVLQLTPFMEFKA